MPAEKAPIKRSAEPHMPPFAKCYAKAEDPAKNGDFGVDLRLRPQRDPHLGTLSRLDALVTVPHSRP